MCAISRTDPLKKKKKSEERALASEPNGKPFPEHQQLLCKQKISVCWVKSLNSGAV